MCGKVSVYIMQIMFTLKVSQHAQVSSKFVILIIKLEEGLHGRNRSEKSKEAALELTNLFVFEFYELHISLTY